MAVDPVSILIALDALLNTAFKISVGVHKTLPHSRLAEWREVAHKISQATLHDRMTLPEDQIPNLITRHAMFSSALKALEDSYDAEGRAIKSYGHRRAATKELQKQGKIIRDLVQKLRTDGNDQAFLCSFYHPQPAQGERCPICFPSAAVTNTGSRLDTRNYASQTLVSRTTMSTTTTGNSPMPAHSQTPITSIGHSGMGSDPFEAFAAAFNAPNPPRIMTKMVETSGLNKIVITEEYE
ncbi:hypothetical protein DFH06DRAFT_1315669 [Mycena polygramma]|nr:hypothetical protein DFH06DRAFT_1315669 [Mycena polygramma]